MATGTSKELKKVESSKRFEPRKIKAQEIGLKVLREPMDIEDTEVDIVAVHGIGVHPEETWVFKGNDVNWLKHETMLPAAVPKSRIMAFGYASYWFGDDAVKQSLDSVAKKLLVALKRQRKNCLNRPIVFIGHCFGGLVIQRAYTLAKAYGDDEEFSGVSDSITGVVFLGTPHHGVVGNSGLQTQGQIYQTIVQANVQVQDNVLHSMAENNQILVACVYDFTRLISGQIPGQQHPPKIYCFYEQKAAKVGLIAGIPGIPPEFVVNESSGTLNGHPKDALPLDHFGMNKFEDSHDNNYDSVRSVIVDMAEKSKALMEGREKGKAHSSSENGVINSREFLAIEGSPAMDPRVSIGRTIEADRARNPRKAPNTTQSSDGKYYIPTLAAPIALELYFAPRGKVLDDLEDKFKATMNVVLCGDMGHGKTHIAVEYAHKFHKKNRGCNVHWVNAGSAEEFELSYRRIADNLHVGNNRKGNGVLKAVCDALKQDGNWLMVLDGLNNTDTLKTTDPSDGMKPLLDFIPPAHLARVLITTRSKSLAMRMVNQKNEFVIDVSALKDEDASYLLLGTVTSEEAKKKRSLEVATCLGRSAGTLVMAHLYCKMARLTYKAYQERISLPDKPSTAWPSDMKAWSLLYQHIRETDKEAAHLLLVIGCLNVQSIPKAFFERTQIFQQIVHLIDAGMIEPSTDERVYTMTSLIRQCVQKWLIEKGERHIVEEQVLSIMNNKFAENEYDVSDVLLPCALVILKFQPKSTEGKRYLARLFARVAEYHVRLGRHQKAIELFEQCLTICKRDSEMEGFAIETRQALETTRNQLAQSKTGEKPPSEAKTLANDAAEAKKELRKVENDVGRDHPNTIRKMSDLAALKLAQGEKAGVAEALGSLKEILDWSKRKYGDNDVETARHQYNLAIAHEENGDYKNAAVLYRTAARTAESQLGPGHPELLRILGNLALIYCKQGDLKTAQQALNTVLRGQRETLGWDHPETLAMRQNAAMLLEEMGKVDAAGAELETVLGVQARLLGRNNRATLRTSCSLAMNYMERGLREDAERLLGDTWKVQMKVLGKDDQETVKTKRILDTMRGEM
ncbi:hypothetical protein F5Y04DRAFT_278767 [Hypomontagnella monticulosa]|nr:hypothetical protein F5Y04DRAFT_278767 [Hypomontagnella monticulosa]